MSISLATKGMIKYSNFQSNPTPIEIAAAVWNSAKSSYTTDGTFGLALQSALGLNKENQYMDQTQFDINHNLTSARIRIYSDASSVGTDSNVIATYTVTATYDTASHLDTYKVEKV